MKTAYKIKQLRSIIEDELHDEGYYCLYGMTSHGPNLSYVNEVFSAIDAMTHEIQFRVTVNIKNPISNIIGIRRLVI